MKALPIAGERVLWEGRPRIAAVARDVLHIRWVLLYLAILLVYSAGMDRVDGASIGRSLADTAPLAIAGLLVLAGCLGFARAIARTTRYVITTDRCVLHYGVALTASLSLPLRMIAAIAVAEREGGAGDIALRLKPGQPLRYVKLWPHARPWRFGVAEPMLRGLPDAVSVASLLSKAVVAVNPGVLHGAPATVGDVLPEAELSPAGD